MMKTIANLKSRALATAAALAVAATLAGCQSSGDTKDVQVDEPSDLAGHNRLVVRMALAENVHNAIAVEQAIYPRDFDHAHATFNELGTRRIDTLVDVLRGGSGRIVVVRGDASEALYTERVAAVRKHLDDAGLDLEEIAVARDVHVGGASGNGDRALLTYDRMMTRYAQQQGGGAAGAAGSIPAPTQWSGSGNNSGK